MNGGLEPLLGRAKAQEREYDWRGAAATYGQALGLVREGGCLEAGRVGEARARALFRHAFQAKDHEEFIERLGAASAECDRAKAKYRSAAEGAGTPGALRCDAMAAWIDHWRSGDNGEKKRLALESWRLAIESMDAFEAAGDGLELARTMNDSPFVVSEAYHRSDEFEEREKLAREALAYSEKAARLVEDSPDKEEAARAFFNAFVFTSTVGVTFTELGARGEYTRRAHEWWRRAFESSREATLEALAFVTMNVTLRPDRPEEETTRVIDEAVELSEASNDRLMVGLAMDWLGFWSVVTAHTAEHAEATDGLLEKGFACATRARQELSVVNYIIPYMGPIWPWTAESSYHMWKAVFESDAERKREHAQKALDLWPKNWTAVAEAGYPELASGALWDKIRALNQLSMTEKDPREKRRTLEESLDCIHKYQDICDRFRRHDQHRDYIKSWLADAEYGLSEVVDDLDERIGLIRDAIIHKKEDIAAYCAETASLPAYAALADQAMGDSLYLCGRWSVRLHELTSDGADLRSAVGFFSESAGHFERSERPSRCAEGHWQVGQTQGALGEHEEASESFVRAAECYRAASGKMPRLAEFFMDYESYMRAWSEIEKARHHHLRRESKRAEEHFDKASGLLTATDRWAYLGPDYSAWARLERAEAMSRADSSEEAADLFADAAGLFDKSSAAMRAALAGIEEPDERAMVEDILQASEARKAYCMARRQLEEAKVLDRNGEEGASSERYGAAAKAFGQILQGLEREEERKEMRLAISLARACQAMTKAEAEASSDLYEEAARLFDEAKDLTPSEKERLLMTGHCRFCRALEAGTRFADSGDAAHHSAAIRNLESAAKYYLKARSEKASEYANASRLLLDAYLYMGRAGGEYDQEKRAKLYAVSEKILGASASSFRRAGHPAKEAEMRRLLDKVTRDRELAVSLGDAFTAPHIASGTNVLSTPAPAQERAAGLHKFERADVQAMVIVPRRELRVGDPLDMEIELVNTGKGSAQLTKVENVVPVGFEVLEKPQKYRVEESHIVMKGRRLEPLRTEEVALVLRPTAKGSFVLKPRVLYVDDDGSYRYRETEGCAVTVKELGISGWLKGPERK